MLSMLFNNSAIKILTSAIIILAVVSIFLYVSNLKKTVELQTINIIELQNALNSKEQALVTLENNYEQIVSSMDGLQKLKSRQETEYNLLRDKLEKIEAVQASDKPKLLENRVNAATQKLLECFLAAMMSRNTNIDSCQSPSISFTK